MIGMLKTGKSLSTNEILAKSLLKLKTRSRGHPNASLTFNQYGQDFPIGGMNERGLVIEALWLSETIYPELSDTLKCIDNMQWIQYQLDNSTGVNDVLHNDSTLQLLPVSATTVHYFIADRSGKAMIVESTNGNLNHYLADNSNTPFLTNDPYEKSIRMLNKCNVFGGTLDIPQGNGSITRFIQIGIALKKYPDLHTAPIDYSFNILKSVSLGAFTKWSIVYDINNLTVYYKSKSSKKLKYVNLLNLKTECSDNFLSINIINSHSGNTGPFFTKITPEENRILVVESFKNTPFLKNMSSDYMRNIYTYPESFKCGSK